MGKMVAPQSIVVATTATETYGSEGSILRRVFLHSVALACLVDEGEVAWRRLTQGCHRGGKARTRSAGSRARRGRSRKSAGSG